MNNIQFDQGTFGLLTPREIEIVRAASGGSSIKRTAADFGISPNTVHVHRNNIIRKLKCGNITNAVTMLLKGGII